MTKRKEKYIPTFGEKMLKLKQAGIFESQDVRKRDNDNPSLPSLQQRMDTLLGIVRNKKTTDMLFFIMYDIESNKVRNQIAKYLLKEGCFRIQRSIFLANLPPQKYESIKNDLTEVQACYENNDSILVLPISNDLLNSMRVIGQDISLDVIKQSQTTLFF